MVTATVDDKYRVTIPKELRGEIKPGDALVVVAEQTERGPVLHLARAISPFDVLAEDALRQYERGETVGLEEFLREQGVGPDRLGESRDVPPHQVSATASS